MRIAQLTHDKTGATVLGVLSAVTLIIPLFNLLFPVDSWLHFSAYTPPILDVWRALRCSRLRLALEPAQCRLPHLLR